MPTQTALTALAPSSAASMVKPAQSAAPAVDAANSFPWGSSPADLVTLIKPFTADALVNGFATLIGALLGAMLANALQRRFPRSLELKSELTSANAFPIGDAVNEALLGLLALTEQTARIRLVAQSGWPAGGPPFSFDV